MSTFKKGFIKHGLDHGYIKPKKRKTCQDLVIEKYKRRLVDLEAAFHYFSIEKDSARAAHDRHEDLKHYEDYYDYANQLGLSFDFVDADASEGQSCGYWRWQLSTGGPGDEFRIFTDVKKNIDRIEYVYLDWFDGATHKIENIPAPLAEAASWFLEFSSYDQEGLEI
tara:strand:- start:174 stop:674 length:501 start_codon:yes stop_codon:yes gene_type:complete